MKNILILVFFVIGGGVLAAATANRMSEKTYSWRYKMTVEIETPDGVKTGSAVRQVQVTLIPNPLGHNAPYRVERKLFGEAVVVDLEKRGVVFGLLKGSFLNQDHAKLISYYIFPNKEDLLEHQKFLASLTDIKVVLKEEMYPLLVTFRDLNDPKSVTPVLEMDWCMRKDERGTCKEKKHHIKADHFEELFGKGVHLKSIIVETTDDPVTWGIEQWLPWLPGRKNIAGYLGGESKPPFDDPSKTYLNGIEFSKGKFW